MKGVSLLSDASYVPTGTGAGISVNSFETVIRLSTTENPSVVIVAVKFWFIFLGWKLLERWVPK